MSDIVFFIENHIILISIWLFFLIILIVIFSKNISLASRTINNIQAIKLINEDKAIIIDTRSSKLFKEGHIINSINIPLKNIFSGDIKKIKIYKLSPVILILNETYKDNKCIKILSEDGFKNVYILKNGIYDWNLDHLPLVVKDK